MRAYVRSTLFTAFGIVLFFVAISITVDPFRVFGLSHFNKTFEPDTRYLKIQYLLRDQEHNAFVLGSSRVNYYRVSTLQRLTGLDYYNMTASDDSAAGIRRKVEWLLDRKHVAEVVIGLDYDDQSYQPDPYDLLRQDHPSVSHESPLQFYSKYVLVPPELVYRCVRANLSPQATYVIHVDTGQYERPQAIVMKRMPLDKLLRENSQPHDDGFGGQRALQSVVELKATLELLKRSHVKTIVVVNPYSAVKYLSFDRRTYFQWLRELAQATGGFWDFSGLNSVTMNPNNYYNESHFTEHVGDLVIARVLGAKTPDAQPPLDFGVLLTKANVDDYIRRTESNLENVQRHRISPGHI